MVSKHMYVVQPAEIAVRNWLRTQLINATQWPVITGSSHSGLVRERLLSRSLTQRDSSAADRYCQ